jgi:hypothetical protein
LPTYCKCSWPHSRIENFKISRVKYYNTALHHAP